MGYHVSLSLETSQHFSNFYLKDLTWSDNDNTFLGPVVAAQQVLDPSPQSNPRKEKKGGGGGAHLLQPSLRSLLQILGISLPHQGVLGKVFISFKLNFLFKDH